jgi:hypothetical protein
MKSISVQTRNQTEYHSAVDRSQDEPQFNCGLKIVAIHAEAVEILVRKAGFEPKVALGVAEAMEVSITLAQLVTVPVLDACLQELKHELKAEIQALRADFNTLRADFNLLKEDFHILRGDFNTLRGDFKTLRAEFDTLRAEFNTLRAEFETLGEKFNGGIEKAKAELVRWVFVTMLGSVALSAAANQVLKAFAN